MNEKLFIIAGNLEQAKTFRTKKIQQLVREGASVSLSNFILFTGLEQFRGHNKVHGFFCGTYKDRPDIRDIVREIKRINNLHASETVIPDIFVGQGIQSPPRASWPLPPNTKHTPLPTRTKPNEPCYVFRDGVIQPPDSYTAEVVDNRLEVTFNQAPPQAGYIQIQYGKDVNILFGNGSTNVFTMPIPYSLL